MKLRDKHVLLTGGSKGLGAALAPELTRRGARVTLVARKSAELEAVAEQTGAVALPLDLSDLDALERVVATAEEHNGPLDVLISNAALVRLAPFADFSADDLRCQLFTNLIAPMELARQAVPGMLARDRGLIINVASLSASVSVPNTVGYSVSKTGLAKFTVDLQTELRGTRVKAMLVSLGAVGGTPMLRQFEDDPRTGGLVSRIKTLTTPAADVARRILDGAESGRAYVTVPKLMTPLVYYNVGPMRLIGRAVDL